jgi:hypothetical protein
MRNLRRTMTLLVFLVISAAFGYANVISYTFTGAGGDAGTDWTLVDPSGYIPRGVRRKPSGDLLSPRPLTSAATLSNVI